MILSNVEIHRALDEGRLIILPEPAPRFPGLDSDCPYQTSAVDLRLGNEISYFKEGLAIDINLRRGSFAQLFGPCNISLYPAAPICQLIFETVDGTPIRNDSQFQGQKLPGGNVAQVG